MSEKEILSIVHKIKFLDWKFEAEIRFETLVLRILVSMVDNDNPFMKTVVQQGSAWPIDYVRGLKREEFAKIIFDLILAQLRHEAEELFYYDNGRPFNEHNTETDKLAMESIFLRDPVGSEWKDKTGM